MHAARLVSRLPRLFHHDRLLILRHFDVPVEFRADVFGQTQRLLFFAVREEQLPRRVVEVAQPAEQLAAVGMAGETVDLLDLGLHLVTPAVDPHFRLALDELPAQFPGLAFSHAVEREVDLDEAVGHHGPAMVIEMLGVRGESGA